MFFGFGGLHWMDIPILLAFGLSIWAQFKVQGTFRRWTEVPSSSGITGYEAARRILDNHGLYDVKIEPVQGTLTDHYVRSIRSCACPNPYTAPLPSQRSPSPATKSVTRFNIRFPIRCWSHATGCSRGEFRLRRRTVSDHRRSDLRRDSIPSSDRRCSWQVSSSSVQPWLSK